jgi:hypothetical protein
VARQTCFAEIAAREDNRVLIFREDGLIRRQALLPVVVDEPDPVGVLDRDHFAVRALAARDPQQLGGLYERQRAVLNGFPTAEEARQRIRRARRQSVGR